jgi:hypothetical protein
VLTGRRHLKKIAAVTFVVVGLLVLVTTLRGVVGMINDLAVNLIVSVGVAAGSRVQGSATPFL